jgi:hypothetical protein
VRVVVVTFVLGVGTALTFAAALVTAAAFPNGTLVPGGASQVRLRPDMPMVQPLPPPKDPTVGGSAAGGGWVPVLDPDGAPAP